MGRHKKKVLREWEELDLNIKQYRALVAIDKAGAVVKDNGKWKIINSDDYLHGRLLASLEALGCVGYKFPGRREVTALGRDYLASHMLEGDNIILCNIRISDLELDAALVALNDSQKALLNYLSIVIDSAIAPLEERICALEKMAEMKHRAEEYPSEVIAEKIKEFFEKDHRCPLIAVGEPEYDLDDVNGSPGTGGTGSVFDTSTETVSEGFPDVIPHYDGGKAMSYEVPEDNKTEQMELDNLTAEELHQQDLIADRIFKEDKKEDEKEEGEMA